MARIPLQLAQRRLDTGNAVQYPNGSPVGGAMQGFGDQLSAVAERYQQMKDQQEAFDAELARRQFNGQVAQAEDEVAANAPADGTGLHETMYGQVDPRSGRVVKAGLFDTLFDDALPNMPESQRDAFATRKEPMRAVGARRMAQRQRQRRQDYELAQVDTVLQTNAIAIAQGDPDDGAAFEAARQDGLDLIDKMGGDPGIRQQKVKDWFSTAAKTRFEALIAKDPKRAAELLGAAQVEVSTRRAVEAARSAGSTATATENAYASGNALVGSVSAVQLTAPSGQTAVPPEDSQEAFQQAPGFTPANGSGAATSKGDRVQNDNSAPADRAAVLAAAPWIADLSPSAMQDLGQGAQAAMARSLVDARTDISLAYQNAPDALMYTGNYSGAKPGPEAFTAVYGVEEGGKQLQDFNKAFAVGHRAFGMRIKSNEAIETEVLSARPRLGSVTPEQDQAQFEIASSAALQVLYARWADAGGYVRKVFLNVDAAWSKVTRPDSESWKRRGVPDRYDSSAYGNAMAVSVAAQEQMGIENIRPLPLAVVENIVETFNDKDVPQADKDAILRDLSAGASSANVRIALSRQLAQAGLPQPIQTDPITTATTPATVQGPVKSLPLMPSEKNQSVFGHAAADFGDYLSESAEALGRIPNGIREFVDDLRDDPLDAINRLPVNPTSGVSAIGVEGAAVANSLSRIFTEALAGGRIGGGRKLFKPLEEAVSEGAELRSVVAKDSAGLTTAERTSVPRKGEASPTPSAQSAVPSGGASVGQDLHVTYMSHWNDVQRAAADLKVKMLTEAATVVSRAIRKGKSAREIFKKAGFLIPFGNDIDHIIDLQLGGLHHFSNLAILDSSVNRSLGAQIWNQIKDLPIGTVINKVTIGER